MAWPTSTASARRVWRATRLCGNLPKEIVRKAPRTPLFMLIHSGKSRLLQVYPPPPPPSECLDWRGVCKKCLQNLDVKELRGQNLDNKGVRPSAAAFVSTASASTIIRSFCDGGKVTCHMRPVDFAFGSRFSPKEARSGHASVRGAA